MSNVTVTVNRQPYLIACDDGQEERVLELARRLDERVSELVASVGQVGDQRLLVMAAMMIEDEVDALRPQQNGGVQPPQIDEAALAARIEQLAARIAGLAERGERD